jgi:hypothetical protein
MSHEPLDLTALQQLVAFWRNRAEQLRAGAAGQPGRAELFDACAAQLAIAIEEVKQAAGQHPDTESLPLFDDPTAVPPSVATQPLTAASPPAASSPAEGDDGSAGVIALSHARRRRPEQRG